MALRINTIDFHNIQNRIDAAQSLQAAGENAAAENVMTKLARGILADINGEK